MRMILYSLSSESDRLAGLPYSTVVLSALNDFDKS